MKNRKIIAIAFLIVGVALSINFFLKIEFLQGVEAYFKRAYYNQFGPFVISIELIMASYYLLIGHKKTNFSLALFGFTALLDPIFNVIGLFNSLVPLYGTIIFSICAIVCLWLAFSNTFKLKRISILSTVVSVIISVFVELFFNYLN
ncbi:hypothetical protein PK35_01610 [Tamlana nanhaiensis]|uniref:DoxX family protein n=1 Tax=Neotamlana nanhaiensis TaxID=1382798 RepID=A0A0D7W660_9FLAO|nr:hypothetical protein [Tamlana nanhaiensis]KJD34514.1 hypothetical protein PK35_01610 [Tamlana nanhaiensis]